MSTSLLYHGFWVRGYEYMSTGYSGGRTTFRIALPRERLRCPQCGGADVVCRGYSSPRLFLGVPIGNRPTQLEFEVPRVECLACGITRQVDVGFADPHKRHTRQFARYALDLTDMMTIQDAALHLQVGWDLVRTSRRRTWSGGRDAEEGPQGCPLAAAEEPRKPGRRQGPAAHCS